MQAAEVLGIRTEDIRPLLGHSDSVGYNMGSSSSRTTMATGLAACMAAEDVKRQMVQRAATLWGVDLGTLQYDRGAVRSIHDTALTMTFAQLAARQQETGGPIVANAATRVTGSSAVGAGTIVDVHVDPDTGKVDILRCTVVQDAGRAVHPGNVEGQMQGATAQGIGWGLSEGLAYDNDGRLLNPSFLDYRLPTTTDLPNIDPVIVEVPNPTHPFGVRGVGEISLVTPAPAIANAIYAAVGVRMDSMPMDPTTVLSKLRTKSS